MTPNSAANCPPLLARTSDPDRSTPLNSRQGEAMSPYRVIQWAPGLVGKMSLKGILTHPGLELAGLWVHSPGKAGIDAGEFCGLPTTGIVSSADADEVLAL